MNRYAARLGRLERQLKERLGDGQDHSRCPRLVSFRKGEGGRLVRTGALDLLGRPTDQPICPACPPTKLIGIDLDAI